MKPPKRIYQILEDLDKIQEVVNYCFPGKQLYVEEFNTIRMTLQELSIDRKIDHVRFAKKLKSIWEKTQKN